MLTSILVSAVALTGCESPGGGPGPFAPSKPLDHVTMPMVIARVNENSAAMNFLLRGGGAIATGEYSKNGKQESFELKGTLLYRKPRDLYMKLDHLAGKLEIGSNSEEFWVWEQLGDDRYWWGEHANIKHVDVTDMPIRPDHLLEVLGLHELPTEPDGADGPVFLVGSARYELLFLERDATGRSCLARAVDIDRKPPYLIREMVYFRPDGHPRMTAKLSEYRNVQGSKVLAPHLIKMRWLENDNWMNLKFDGMKRYEQAAAAKKFVSPRQKGENLGMVKRVDHPRTSTQPGVEATDPPLSVKD